MSARKYVFTLCVFLLTACTSTQDYETALDQWIGRSEKELVSAWGIPDKQYDASRRTRMLAYVRGEIVTYPGTPPNCHLQSVDRVNAYSYCSEGLPPVIQTLRCETTFTIEKGIIRSWSHRGNNCRL